MRKFNDIPEDLITDKDQEAVIAADMREEEQTEQILGSKFIVREFEETSSSMDSVNQRIDA